MTAGASERVRLGDWTCPSGNNVEVFLRPHATGGGHVEFEWDSPPPLTDADAAHYAAVIRPTVLARVREYTERTGSALVIEL